MKGPEGKKTQKSRVAECVHKQRERRSARRIADVVRKHTQSLSVYACKPCIN